MNSPVTQPGSEFVPTKVPRWLRATFLSLLMVGVLITVALGAFTMVMARVPAYRAQMQTWLSERAKLDIQFDSLRAGWRGYGPELVFTHAILRSQDHQRIVALAEQGSVGFDLWQAVRTGRLNAARFRLEGTELKLQRNQDGSFEFIGQTDWPEFDTDSAFKLDSLPVGELAIRRVKFSFRDLKTGRGPWSLSDIALDISRDAEHLNLQGRAYLPTELGQDLRFEAQATGNLDEMSQLNWQAAIHGARIDLAGWKQVMPDDWVAPITGKGSFELGAAFIGHQPQQLTGKIDFVDVALKLPVWALPLPKADVLQQSAPVQPQQSEPISQRTLPSTVTDSVWQYSKIAVQFDSDHTPLGWSTQFTNLQLDRSDTPWPAGSARLMVQFTKHDTGLPTLAALHASAQTVVLENLWPLLSYLPETQNHAHWRALNARGRVRNLELNYEQPESGDDENSAPTYGVQFDFEELGLAPVNTLPGVSGVSGKVNATHAGGSLLIDSRNVALSIPRLFRTPLPMDRLTSAVDWTRTPQDVSVNCKDIAIENMDGRVQAKLALTILKEGSSVIDMQATATELVAASTPRYLPVGIMHKDVIKWLDAAFLAGNVTSAQAVLRGPLDKFPFRKQEGDFLVTAQLEGVALHYQEGWKPATEMNVTAEFHNAGFKASASAGRLHGLIVDQVDGSMKDYLDSELLIKGTVHGGVSQGLSFVQQSPVGPAIGELFQRASAKGVLQAQVNMDLPFKHFDKHTVDIDLRMANSTLTLPDVQQAASDVNGTVHIKNNEVTAANVTGRFLQGEFRMKADPVSGGHYNLVADGQLNASSLSQLLNLPAWLKLSGGTSYRFTMPGYPQIDAAGIRHLYSVTSNLAALQIDLPEPVNKPARDSRSLRFDADMPNDSTLQLRGTLGELRSLVRLQHGRNGWQFDRAGLRLDGVAASLPAHSGLRLEGRVSDVTLDDWLRLGITPESSHSTKVNTVGGVQVQDILRAANVTLERFNVYGFQWPSLRAVLQATDAGWRIDVAGEQATGQVTVPYRQNGSEPLTLKMDSLWLTHRDSVSTAQRNPQVLLDPRDLPSIRADIKDFRVGEHDFGALQVTANRTAQGLQVDSLRISGDSFKGVGQGSWLQGADGQINKFSFNLDSSDVRSTLNQFKYGDVLAGKRGKLVADLQWPGGVDAQLLGRASGTLEVQVDEGQVLNVEPGAGRVLGLLSVTALPRRLGLDFRDLTDKGLAFDSVHADFNITHGDARTQNLILRGPTAEIGIVGRMGLGAHDYDQTAVVTGNVGGALPVAAVAAGVPVVGAALLVFSQVFKEPLKGMARAYYHIGGSWDEPKIERIEAEVGKASLSGSESGTTP